MKKTLNGDQLKLIAILAMTVDHVTDLIYPGLPAVPAAILLHIIGRLTAPIMWFFISEGFHYHRLTRADTVLTGRNIPTPRQAP